MPTVRGARSPPLAEAPLSEDHAAILASRLKAVAEPARLRLVSLVLASPGQEACICDLTAPLGLSQPTVSHHMKVLVDAGLLTREKRGRGLTSGRSRKPSSHWLTLFSRLPS